MRFEWDPAKAAANLAKHGLDFAEARHFDWATSIYLADDVIDGEVRTREIGWLDGQLVVIVHVERGDRIRLISMRHATRQEWRLHGR